MFRLFRDKTGIQLLKKSLSKYEPCIENAAKETIPDFEKMANSLGSGDFLAGAPASGIRMFTLEERASRIQQAREIDIPVIATLEHDIVRADLNKVSESLAVRIKKNHAFRS